MRLNKFLKNEVKSGMVFLAAGGYDYIFMYNKREKIWNCSIYDSKKAEIAHFFDEVIDPIKEVTYKNDSEVIEVIKSL